MSDEFLYPTPSFRRALPRIGLDERSALPLRRLAELLTFAGERNAAVDAYRELLVEQPGDLDAMERLAGVLARLGRADEELALRREIAARRSDELGLAPELRDAVVAFEMAALGVADAPPAAPAAYVAATFDVVSATFDDRLRRVLRYRGPEAVVERVARAHGAGDGSLAICDAGCGTGLVGPLLRPYARALHGVDLSPGMLDRARALGVYDELVVADLTAFFQRSPRAYDVITAADVFVYVGDLRPVFAAIAGALRPSGILVSTHERAEREGFVLHDAGRYAHSLGFVREALHFAGLEELSLEEEDLRREQGATVRALVAACRLGVR